MSVTDLNHLQDDLLDVYRCCVEDKEEERNGLVKAVIDLVLRDFRAKGYLKELFYTGSAYEKLSVGSSHDFDIDVILDVPGDVRVQQSTHGDFVMLKSLNPRSNLDFLRFLTKKRKRYSAVLMRRLLVSFVDQAIGGDNMYNGESYHLSRSIHGPATTLHIHHSKFGEITVDLVAAIRVDGSTYKAKPLVQKDPDNPCQAVFWRKSYSEAEKTKLDGIDTGNQVRRKVLRIFKAIKACDDTLAPIPSYVYKNVLFYTIDEEDDWPEHDLAARFVSYLKKLQSMLQDASIPVYFNQDVNILKARGIKKNRSQQISRYLQKLLAKQNLEGIRRLARNCDLKR